MITTKLERSASRGRRKKRGAGNVLSYQTTQRLSKPTESSKGLRDDLKGVPLAKDGTIEHQYEDLSTSNMFTS